MTMMLKYRQGEASGHEPYHYRECGLDDVYLMNGVRFQEVDGETGVIILNIDGLHRAIARNIVMNKSLMGGRDVRFLRKHLELTQADLAKWLACDPQTVARWEKDQTKIPGSADRLTRMLYASTHLHGVDLPAMIRDVADLDAAAGKQVFRETSGKWARAAA